MRHEYSLAHLTVLSLTPPQLVEVAARTGYEYVGVRITRVTPAEVLYDLARDRALMRETKARLSDTGIAVLDVELFRMICTRLRPRDSRIGSRNTIQSSMSRCAATILRATISSSTRRRSG